ncbi:PhaM family polyhydroxyalkanoate granule multifunctional regulatory protein [Undibacterium sp.]|uniref:PhaM family polyhydroxyalkanoate granule multifunctional regulatory protein n=1 Tax=Undibacterium sp. TaxID=1914977 RepID=UPI00374FDF1F
MQNPFQAAAGNNLNDPLAFVKKLWGDMQLPGMVTPTLSVDELDKQIKDLKTVESWLNVNMSMLKGTIQALEVQRATISALKTMGESFAQATASSTPAPVPASNDAAANWPMHGANKAAAPVPREPTVEENEDEELDEELDEDESAESPSEDLNVEANNAPEKEAKSAKPDNPPVHNPAAWWTVLQDQFKQALSHAMKDEAPTKLATPSSVTPKTSNKVTKKTAAKLVPSGRTTVKKVAETKTSKATASTAKSKAVNSSVNKPMSKPMSKPVQKSVTKVATKSPSKPRARSE